MKATSKATTKNVAKKATKRLMTDAERSEASRAAAFKAHATMQSKKYLLAKKKGRAAVAQYLASRAA